MPKPKQIFEDYYDELSRSTHDSNMTLGLTRSIDLSKLVPELRHQIVEASRR